MCSSDLLQANDIQPVCPTPFSSLFVGYDGQYYLCCSDWKKEVPLGSVADVAFADVVLAKLAHTRDRGLVCRTCNLDPLNRLVEVMRARDAGEVDPADVDQELEKIRGFTEYSLDHVEVLTGSPAPARSADGLPANGRSARRTIPVTAT